MKTGWYGTDEYYVVKTLENGYRQQLIVCVQKEQGGRWNVFAGVFSSNSTYNSIKYSDVWKKPTSTNKNPSPKTIFLALEALKQIEEELHNKANGKRWYIYVDGLDKRRLHAYTRILTKKCNYKISSVTSYYCGLPLIYKRV